MSYTNKQTRSKEQILMFGNRTWLTKAMHIEIPKRLFRSQCPDTSQAITNVELINANIPCILVNVRQQHRVTNGSTNPS
eukprot:Gb_14424 [translate_table: standard]